MKGLEFSVITYLSLLSLKGVWGYRGGTPVGFHPTSHSASSSSWSFLAVFKPMSFPTCQGLSGDPLVHLSDNPGAPREEYKILDSFYAERSGSRWKVVA